jgi:Xaa-Pro aminopeptidase
VTGQPLAGLDLAELQRQLVADGLDGWLLYDFHGINPVAVRMLNIEGLATRRLFVWLPASGTPVAVAHRVELQGLAGFPGEIRPYATWQELHQHLGGLIKGRRVAMEYSADDAVPYLDRVPAGVLDMVRRQGARVASSAALVTGFAARWTSAELTDHKVAAESLAEIARVTLRETVRQIGAREIEVQRRVMERMTTVGIVAPWPPIVAFGANTANPHYTPREADCATLAPGDVVLIEIGRASSS